MDSSPDGAPAEKVSVDQLVALNIRHWRTAAGLTQAELGERLGWSAANVSAAERSVDPARDARRFDAQTLTELALALGVPLAALFLPPDDDGKRVSYCFTATGRTWGMGDLMELVVMPDSVDDSPLLEAYRERFNAAAMRAATGPAYARLVSRWAAGNPGMSEGAAEELRDTAARLAKIAEWIAPEADK
jgi:transcriptional regulator with XRE-family HTH domain